MAIYVVYCGQDLKSYIAPLEISDSYTITTPPIPSQGWRTMSREGHGELDPLHKATGFGSVQIVVSGAVDIGVTAGEVRQITAGVGDVVVFTDVEGDGHWAQRNHDDQFCAVNIRLADDWQALLKGFKGWPDNIRPWPGA